MHFKPPFVSASVVLTFLVGNVCIYTVVPNIPPFISATFYCRENAIEFISIQFVKFLA